jgi:hypothetical protein
MRSYLAFTAVCLVATNALADGKARSPAPPRDYASEVKTLFRIGACGNDDAVADKLPRKAITAHCKEMADLYASYKRAWGDRAGAFIAKLKPADLPTTVVYPFGGGDLTSALVVYPEATEITTISLEAAGDVRTVDTISNKTLVTDLDTIGGDIRRLYRSAHSTTKSLQAASHSELPGSLMFALAGLAVNGFEPVALHYFDIEPDGTITYLSDDTLNERNAELVASKRDKVKKPTTHFWFEQDSAFANVEIQYRPRGDAKAPLRTYRHIVMNLDDAHLTADGRVLAHLRKKGKVAVMTKAASFLLWYDDFTQIRDYLLKNVAWMVSDASGIPPSYAGPAGFEQVTYGEFTGPYFIIDSKNTRSEFVKLWKTNPHQDLPFRFGYPDAEKHNHLMIMRPKSAP